jgi:3-hydroxybutyryl-CoA dehydratase
MNAATGELIRLEDLPIGRTHSISRTVSAADVDEFARLSGDLNPLHMDPDFAARTPFGRRVVHGLFTGALVSTAHTQLTGPGFAYVGQELRFLGPVFIGDTVNVELTVLNKKPAKRILIIDTVVRNQRGEHVLAGLSALKELRFA